MKREFMAIALAASAFSGVTAAVQSATEGLIAGVVTDSDNIPLPGASITATDGATVHRQGSADTRGRFRLELPPGTYTLIANFPGFQRASRERVRVAAGQLIAVGFALPLACLQAGDFVNFDVNDLLNTAEFAAHVRVTDVAAEWTGEPTSSPCQIVHVYRARTLQTIVVKGLAPTDATLVFRSWQEVDPLRPGDETIVFVTRAARDGLYWDAADKFRIPVRDGRTSARTTHLPGIPTGTAVMDVFQQLANSRALGRQRP